jgi:hypothetical protein
LKIEVLNVIDERQDTDLKFDIDERKNILAMNAGSEED